MFASIVFHLLETIDHVFTYECYYIYPMKMMYRNMLTFFDCLTG